MTLAHVRRTFTSALAHMRLTSAFAFMRRALALAPALTPTLAATLVRRALTSTSASAP